ncbi:MAG TPA: ABC transporter ATP-binding protein [Polyangiaceae bacterium]|nr:ABC transporter ATP-binding protein [Polyangiaceae bacterium]
MALPLTLIELGSEFLALPIIAGAALEILRGAVRRGLRRQLRASFIREAARQALDKRTLVPEAEVESAFWAAHLLERAIAVHAPALLAAGLAGVSVLVLAAPAMSDRLVGSLLALSVLTLGLTIWSNRRHAVAVDAVAEQRQRAAGWVAAAERDGGEIYGERARAPFLVRLTRSVEDWSSADDRLEVKRLQHRLLLGAFFLSGLLLIFRLQHVDPLHLAPERTLSVHNISGLLVLGTAVPIGYVFALHADLLLAAYASLTPLLPRSSGLSPNRQPLQDRPSRLAARGLWFSYPVSSPKPALASVDFDVDLGRVVLIIAPNGAGKTTLARLICGVLTPDQGSLRIDDAACCDVARDDFGFVPQNPLIVEALSIEDNVRLVAPTAATDAIEQLLAELGLQRPLQQLAGELSRGQQRRIAVARAILKGPRLLLLDEPDVWLDADGRAQLANVLERQLVERAVVVVSHRREWLPNDANVIDIEAHPPFVESIRAPDFGKSKACGQSSSLKNPTS